MDFESIATLCVFFAVTAFSVIRAIVAFVRAKRAGIVRFIRPHETDFFVFGVIMLVISAVVAAGEFAAAAHYKNYAEDMENRGTAAIAEYRGVPAERLDASPSEENLVQSEIELFTQKKRRAGALGLLYSGMFTLILAGTLTSSAAVTKTGIYPLNGFSKVDFAAARRGKRIILYNPKTERIIFKIRASDGNIRFFQPKELS